MTVPDPRENPDLLGHDAAETAMADALRAGRVHHAWLLTGPVGVGKATLAYRFARRLLAGPDAKPQRRGQISRQLTAELQKAINDGND